MGTIWRRRSSPHRATVLYDERSRLDAGILRDDPLVCIEHMAHSSISGGVYPTPTAPRTTTSACCSCIPIIYAPCFIGFLNLMLHPVFHHMSQCRQEGQFCHAPKEGICIILKIDTFVVHLVHSFGSMIETHTGHL
jgi:hypothetical protein